MRRLSAMEKVKARTSGFFFATPWPGRAPTREIRRRLSPIMPPARPCNALSTPYNAEILTGLVRRSKGCSHVTSSRCAPKVDGRIPIRFSS